MAYIDGTGLLLAAVVFKIGFINVVNVVLLLVCAELRGQVLPSNKAISTQVHMYTVYKLFVS